MATQDKSGPGRVIGPERKRSRTWRVGTLAAIAGSAALVLGACGGSDGPSTSEMLDGVAIDQAITDLGGTCEVSGTQGRSNCDADGISFQLVYNSWVTQAGQRERECQREEVSLTQQVLTNHSWIIYTDEDSELERLQGSLTEVGAPSQIKGYCEWDADAGGTG